MFGSNQISMGWGRFPSKRVVTQAIRGPRAKRWLECVDLQTPSTALFLRARKRSPRVICGQILSAFAQSAQATCQTCCPGYTVQLKEEFVSPSLSCQQLISGWDFCMPRKHLNKLAGVHIGRCGELSGGPGNVRNVRGISGRRGWGVLQQGSPEKC